MEETKEIAVKSKAVILTNVNSVKDDHLLDYLGTNPNDSIADKVIEPLEIDAKGQGENDDFGDFGEFSVQQPTETMTIQQGGLPSRQQDFDDFGDFDSAHESPIHDDNHLELTRDTNELSAARLEEPSSPFMDPLPSDPFEENFIEELFKKSKVWRNISDNIKFLLLVIQHPNCISNDLTKITIGVFG